MGLGETQPILSYTNFFIPLKSGGEYLNILFVFSWLWIGINGMEKEYLFN